MARRIGLLTSEELYRFAARRTDATRPEPQERENGTSARFRMSGLLSGCSHGGPLDVNVMFLKTRRLADSRSGTGVANGGAGRKNKPCEILNSKLDWPL
jgi:hypothetical protein